MRLPWRLNCMILIRLWCHIFVWLSVFVNDDCRAFINTTDGRVWAPGFLVLGPQGERRRLMRSSDAVVSTVSLC